MIHTAPQVYINDQLMDAYALDDAPVLGGMELVFGTESDIEYAGPDELQLQLLIRKPADLSFLDLGNIVAVCHPGNATGFGGYTYFVGRLQRCTAETLPGGRLQISLTAAGMLADLENVVTYDMNISPQTAQNRSFHYSGWTPAGWQILSFGPRFPERMHSSLYFQEKPFLELLDLFLRAQLMQRADYSTYIPGTGVKPQIVLFHDTTRSIKPDKLIRETDGTWGITAGGPAVTHYGTIRQEARNIRLGVGWTKEPEDVITEVSVARALTSGGKDTQMIAGSSLKHFPGTAEARAKYGIRTVEFETDLPADGWGQQSFDTVKPIWQHWISVQSPWRAKTVEFVDSDKLTPGELQQLLQTTGRGRIFLVIRHLLQNRPDHGYADLRGVVIGGKAVWTGTKWELSLALSRLSALPAAGGDFWTAVGIGGTYLEPYANNFTQGTCANVGDELSFADFKRIGHPYQ